MRRRLKRTIAQSVSLPFEMLERLDRVAYHLRLTKSAIITQALERELPQFEAKVGKVGERGADTEEPASSAAQIELAGRRP
jgi:predicted DNA-binding protein